MARGIRVLAGVQVGQTRGLVELGKVLKHLGQYSGGAAFSCTIVLSERHFGQAGSGSGSFKAGSLSTYLIQRFRALLRLSAIGRRALLFDGDEAAAMRFDTFSRWTTSDDFI